MVSQQPLYVVYVVLTADNRPRVRGIVCYRESQAWVAEGRCGRNRAHPYAGTMPMRHFWLTCVPLLLPAVDARLSRSMPSSLSLTGRSASGAWGKGKRDNTGQPIARSAP